MVGALVGAAVGSVLGYVGSYHLARRNRNEEVQERRKRLMRALATEISLEIRDLKWAPGLFTLSTGVYLSTLAPLIDLAADPEGGELLQALAHLRSRSDSYNDVIGWTNPMQTLRLDGTELTRVMADAEASYREVQRAAERVRPLLTIPS